jgi:hypothetical protein
MPREIVVLKIGSLEEHRHAGALGAHDGHLLLGLNLHFERYAVAPVPPHQPARVLQFQRAIVDDPPIERRVSPGLLGVAENRVLAGVFHGPARLDGIALRDRRFELEPPPEIRRPILIRLAALAAAFVVVDFSGTAEP